MPREQNERRPSKPDLPRVETGDAERLATRFNAIHTRWPGESPSTQPAKPSNAPRHEPLPDRTSVHVSPILKIDGPTPPMPSGRPSLAQSYEAHAASAEAEPWEIDDAPAAQSDAGSNARQEIENDQGSQSEQTAEASAAAIAKPLVESELSEQATVDAAANDTSAAADERLSPTPPLGTERPSKTSVAATAREVHDEARTGVTATFADDVEHDRDADEPEVARLEPRSRWRWLLAALTVGVAGVSLYRTLYVSKSVDLDSTASAIPAAAPPAPPAPPPVAPVLEVEPPVAAAPAAPASAAPAAVAAAPAAATVMKSQAPAQQDEARKAKPRPAPTAPAKGKAPVRKATAAAAGKGAAGDKASKAGAKQSAKDAASGRRKLSAKPRKPPPKKERTGIIKKSPF